MSFEKVHAIWDYYDGIRSGIADFGGAPHYFSCLFDDIADDYTNRFRLFPIGADFMVHVLRQTAIFKAWEIKFHHGDVPLETHPLLPGVDPEYDELHRWLNEQVKVLEPISVLQTATFRVLSGQNEVAWLPASADGQTIDALS